MSVRRKPVFDTGIAHFWPQRGMFESNLPVDKQSYGYSEVWSAIKRLTPSLSVADRARLFKGMAAEFYCIAEKEGA